MLAVKVENREMNEFKRYHPVVNLMYFIAVIGFSCVFMNPVTLLISLVSGFSYSIILNGRKALIFNLLYMLPVVLITALLNPVFNHEGVTILGFFPGDNPLTLEAVVYGIASAIMLWSVICHFSCFNKIMTSDKFVYLFGRAMPSLSLILSMVLRFVPKFKSQIHTVSNAQRCVGIDVTQGSIIKRAKNGIKILSAMISWGLENAIDTADSMKSRGYGLPERTAYSNFKMNKKDLKALVYITVLSVYVIVGGVLKGVYFKYFPVLTNIHISVYSISIYISYILLFTSPIIIELREVIRWKKLRLKI